MSDTRSTFEGTIAASIIMRQTDVLSVGNDGRILQLWACMNSGLREWRYLPTLDCAIKEYGGTPLAERGSNVGSAHPEDFCEQCGRENVTWFAPSDLWNMVARRDDGTDPMLCPVCFIMLAEEKGFINSAWKVSPEQLPGERKE